MWIWCRMEKISWTEHISHEELLKLVEEERSLLTIIIRTRQRNWMGNIMRGDSLQREILIHSFILAISIAPLQVLHYSEALPTTARILYRSFTPKRTGNC